MKRYLIFSLLLLAVTAAAWGQPADSLAPAPAVDTAGVAAGMTEARDGEASTPEALWDAANTAYINGRYDAAIEGYQQILSRGLYSAKLYYNLANASFKAGRTGRAILFYHRALRLAIHLLRMEPDSVADMTRSIDDFRQKIRYCRVCNNLSDEEVCPICLDDERDRTTICVVEQVADVLSIENTHQYKGLYHVLGGVISPMQGISPSDLKIDLLTERIARGGVKEVILAISTSVEGETTLFYLMNRLRQFPGVKVTSIARGIGFGDELEYVDELTITHALRNRREVE